MADVKLRSFVLGYLR